MNARQWFQRLIDTRTDAELESLQCLVEVLLEKYDPEKTNAAVAAARDVNSMSELARSLADGSNGT